MGAGIGLLICLFPVVFGIAVLVGAVIFRAAVNLANKVVGGRGGGPTNTQFGYSGDSFGSGGGSFDESNPFAQPMTRTIAVDPSVGSGIPEPTFGRACLIVFVNGLVAFGLGIVMGLIGGNAGADQGTIRLLSQILGIVVAIVVYQAMLPTTIGRAALVWLFQLLIIFAIALVILAVIFATGFALN
jgi:hypothetical protein